MPRKKTGFLIYVFIVLIVLALGTAGFLVYAFLSSPSLEGNLDVVSSDDNKTEVKSAGPMVDMGIDEYLENYIDQFNLIKEDVIHAPIMSEISIEKDGEYYPASAWVAALLYKSQSISDIPGGIPYTRIETMDFPGVFNGKMITPFTVRWKDKVLSFKETPQAMKSIVSYQKNVGVVPLLVTFVWSAPALTNLDEWINALKGFELLVSREESGVESGLDTQGASEHFLHHPLGGKAILKIRDGNVVYADVTILSDAFEKLQSLIQTKNIPMLPSELPDSFLMGDWGWRKRGIVRPDFIKTSVTYGMSSVFSLYQWTSDRNKNSHLVYGLARTWNGFLSDLSFWFDKNKWEDAKKDVFEWFDIEGFNFSQTSAPIEKNGLEMFLLNIDEKIVVVNIRDVKVAKMADIFSDGWGDNLAIEIREDYAWKIMRTEMKEEKEENGKEGKK